MKQQSKGKKMHDSGKRQQFEGGAQRDTAEGKPPMHLLSPHMFRLMLDIRPIEVVTDELYQVNMWSITNLIREYVLTRDVLCIHSALGVMLELFGLERLTEWLRQGAAKYSAFNWAKGMPFTRVLDSLLRHLAKWDKTDEDHPAAMMCNLMFLLHYEYEIKAGRLDAKWNDMFNFNLTQEKETTDVK